MSIPFRRRGRRREHGFGQLCPPVGAATELPPAMWLPPLRPAAPEGVPAGIGLGTFKPQRELQRTGWQAPSMARLQEWEPLPPPTREAPSGRHVWLVAGIGAAGGMLLFAAALDIGRTAAVSAPLEPATPAATGGSQMTDGGDGAGTGAHSGRHDEIALWLAPEMGEGGVTAAALAVAPPDTEPNSRWQMPLERWSAVTDRYGAPRGNGVVHGGIDLALDGMRRSPVHTACEGVVGATGYSKVYGYHVIVDCGDGWSTLYGHLSEIRVQAGQAVTFEDVIGVSGTSGQAEGEHLHFEIRWQGAAVNPERYLDFHIPAGRPLTYDRRDANGNLITPEPPAPPSTPAPPPTGTPTLTPTPTNTPTPRPTRTAAEEATAEAIDGAVRR